MLSRKSDFLRDDHLRKSAMPLAMPKMYGPLDENYNKLLVKIHQRLCVCLVAMEHDSVGENNTEPSFAYAENTYRKRQSGN